MTISRQAFPGLGPASPPSDFAWFHVVLTTYGTWLPGDPRGFRTRHHREHVAGDYRSPPEQDYSARLRRSKSLLKQQPVHLEEDKLAVVGVALVERLRHLGGFVLVAAVNSTHAHMLAKIPAHETRNWAGLAKKHAWYAMRSSGCSERLWAKRAKFTPVLDQHHRDNCLRYIAAHQGQGAWVWLWEGLSDKQVEGLLKQRGF